MSHELVHPVGTPLPLAAKSPAFSRSVDRQILALAIPALGTLAADPLVSIVDTAFVGRLGVVPLAALGVNTALFTMAFVIFNFLAYGTTPRVARAVGRGDSSEAGRAAVQALTLAVAVGGVAAGLLLVFGRPLLLLMGAGGELLEPALAYLRIRALAGPALLIITAGHGIFRGHQDTRTPLGITLGLNAVNLVLDPVFIFGFGWGLEGAAWATLIAQWTGALWFLFLLFRSKRSFLGVDPKVPSFSEILPFLRVGGQLSVRTLALASTLTLATAIAARVGTREVAVHQVAVQLWIFLALVVDALAVAAQALVGRYRGVGTHAQVRAVADRHLLWGACVGLALALLFLALAPVLPLLFTDDSDTIAGVRQVLPFIIWMQPLNALVFVWDGIYMGKEAFRFLAGQMLIAAFLATVILLAVLPLGWGLMGVWWGIVALMGVRATTLGYTYWARGRTG